MVYRNDVDYVLEAYHSLNIYVVGVLMKGLCCLAALTLAETEQLTCMR